MVMSASLWWQSKGVGDGLVPGRGQGDPIGQAQGRGHRKRQRETHAVEAQSLIIEGGGIKVLDVVRRERAEPGQRQIVERSEHLLDELVGGKAARLLAAGR